MKRIKVLALGFVLGIAGIAYAVQSNAQSTPEVATAAAGCCSMQDCCADGACKMNGECCSSHKH